MRSIVRHIEIWMVALLVIGCVGSGSLADTRIGVSQGQKDQLKALAANTRDRTGRERDAMRRARMDLLQVYSSYTIDEHKARIASDRVSAAQLNLLNIHLDNEIALRNVLNADQFQRFRDMMKRRMREPQMLVLAPPEEDILDRLPGKAMLDSLGVSPDQQKLLKPSNPGLIQTLRTQSKQVLDLYANYSLDSAAARKLIDSIHEKQTALLALQHHRQLTIRQVLSPDQFQRLQQEIAKSVAGRDHRRDRRQ
jgi:Spy/CpxP family protein refolding chaperone